MTMKRSILLSYSLFLTATIAYGQISGGFCVGGSNNSAGNLISCFTDLVDSVSVASAQFTCVSPPSPLAAFDIGARAFATCPNQPVDNFASVQGPIGGVQAISHSKATALFFNRTIHEEIRGGDCLGNSTLLFISDDPQGCQPPPPPPPPPPPGGPGCGDGGSGFTRGTGGDGSNCSPIIIDTKGEGFHLTSADGGATFDIAGDGHPVQIAWTDSHFHNAFLVLPGSDGLVHNGKELFGNFTPQPQTPDPNGFLALAQFDKPENGGNGDGIIDDKDTAFPQLRLWIDENHDGVCQPNELHRLPELGVYSLSLSYGESRRTDQFGNVFRYRGRVNPGVRRDPRDETPTGEPGRWEYDVFLTTK